MKSEKVIILFIIIVIFCGMINRCCSLQDKTFEKLRKRTYIGRITSFSVSTNSQNVSTVIITLDNKKQVLEQFRYVPTIETGFLVYRKGDGELVWDLDPTLN